MPVQIKASLFFVLTGALKDAVDLISTPIFTRMLTTDEYGLFSVYNSWYQIIRIIVSLYIFSDGFNVGMARFGDDKESFVSSQQGLMTVMFLFWVSVYLLYRTWWDRFFGMQSIFILLMLIQVMFTTAFNCWQNKKKYSYDYKSLTVVMFFYTILQPLMGIVLIRCNKHGFNNGELRIWSGVGVQIGFGLIVFILQFLKKPVFFRKPYWLFALMTNITLVPHFMSQVLLNQSDRLMIDAFIGKSETAIYSVAHAAAFTLYMVTANINSTFVPWFYEKLKKKDTVSVRQITCILVILAAVAAMGLILVAPEVMRILAKADYYDGRWIIPPLTFSVYLIFIYTLFADVELFYGRNVYVLYSSIIGAASNIYLNYLMIPRYGYFAAGYTTVAGYLLMCMGHYLFLTITCRNEQVIMSEMFDIRIIISVTLAMAVFTACAMFLYRFMLIRYCILVVFMIIIIMNKSSLADLYNKLKSREG